MYHCRVHTQADNLVHHSDSRDDDNVSVASSTPMMPGRGVGDHRSKYYGKGKLWEAALGRRQPKRGGRGTPEDEEIEFDDEELFSHASARSGPPRLGGGLPRMEME